MTKTIVCRISKDNLKFLKSIDDNINTAIEKLKHNYSHADIVNVLDDIKDTLNRFQ